ncbi:L,D-transpeptidase family protein [Faecalimonas sp.]
MSDMKKNKKNVSSQKDTRQKKLLAELESLEVEDLSGFGLKKQNEQRKKEDELVFLYDDDEKNPNYHPQKKSRKSKEGKKWIIISASVVGVLLVVYLGIAFYFNSHFYLSTIINGNKLGGKNVAYAEKSIEQQIAGYELKLKRSDGQIEKIQGKEITLKYQPSNELEKVLHSQNPFLWPKSLFQKDIRTIETGVVYDKQKLSEKINQLKCVKNSTPVKSVSATPVFSGKEFTIKKEIFGNEVNVEKLTKVIEEHLDGLKKEIDMKASKAYYEPKYVSGSKEVISAQETMNKCLNAEIVYDFNPFTEKVDKENISQWLSVDENMQVSFKENSVKEYIKKLSIKYDTSGKPRSFVTATGKTTEVKNGIYGWKINQSAEYTKLTEDILNGKPVKREPEYKRKAVSHQGNDFGNTYAEVDLTTQHMWFFQNGKMMMESPVVTGRPSSGHSTPQGTYTVTYVQKGAVLKGKILPNGKREYETPVDFWMPFNGGIGFHDAVWQSSFGGNRYLTHGSHGCINMPKDKAQQLFGYLKAGIPVICHY